MLYFYYYFMSLFNFLSFISLIKEIHIEKQYLVYLYASSEESLFSISYLRYFARMQHEKLKGECTLDS